MTRHTYKNPLEFNPSNVPEPVFDDHLEYIELYYIAWKQAWDHVIEKEGVPCSPYLDEGFSPTTIWIWDTAFMALFCRYAYKTFPGVESFDNFYKPLHDQIPSTQHMQHPDNPPLFAWAEYCNFMHTGDVERITSLLKDKQYLQKHFDFFNDLKQGSKVEFGKVPVALEKHSHGFMWNGCSSGMDNTPRGRDHHDEIYWLDALAQQALSALYISRLAEAIGDVETALLYKDKHADMANLLNSYYWDDEDGFYYDILIDDINKHSKVKTPASFWPMLAEVATPEQAKRMVESVQEQHMFGDQIPWTSVSVDDPAFAPTGQYWRGSVWVPTAYMAVKALEKYNFQAFADDTAENLLKHVYATYKNYSPHTIWEAYSPVSAEPATTAGDKGVCRPDFCGWSALVPISMLIENVLGFTEVNALENKIVWRIKRTSRHGIKNLCFGDVETDLVAHNWHVEVKTNKPYTLNINGKNHKLVAGVNNLDINL